MRDFLIDIAGGNATAHWTTNGLAMSVVQYGIASPDEWSVAALVPSREHTLTMKLLRPNTWYTVHATSIDTCGSITTSDATFQTESFDPADMLSSTVESGTSLADSYANAVNKTIAINKELSGVLPTMAVEENLLRQQEALRSIAQNLPGPIQKGVPVVNATADSATVKWETDKESNSVILLARPESEDIEYIGNFDVRGTAHAVTIRDLQPNTEYRYRVRNTTIIGTETLSPYYDFKTQDLIGTIEDYESNILSPSKARFRWRTSIETTTGITWTPYRDGEPQSSETRTVTSSDRALTHERILDDLESGTLYDVELWGQTPDGSRIGTVIRAFTTSSEDLPPIILDVSAHPALLPGKDGKIQLTVSWMTNEVTKSAVSYRQGIANRDEPNEGFSIEHDPNFSKKHTSILMNLEPGTVYSFRVSSTDYGGSTSASNVFTILTPKQQQSIFQIITREFEHAFGWLNNLH